jgi:hypothetical protein
MADTIPSTISTDADLREEAERARRYAAAMTDKRSGSIEPDRGPLRRSDRRANPWSDRSLAINIARDAIAPNGPPVVRQKRAR